MPYFFAIGDAMEKEKAKRKEKEKTKEKAKEKEVEQEESKFKRFVKEYVPYIVLLIAILLFKKFVYSPVYVSGESMMSTLHDGDIMILDIIGYQHSELKRFDIVVVNSGRELIIKRVIGLPGETIEYKDNQLYVNGEIVEDNYGSSPTDDFSVTVPKNKYFVLGDNRNNSMDSRFFGPFSRKQIMGKTSFVVFPFRRFGNKD